MVSYSTYIMLSFHKNSFISRSGQNKVKTGKLQSVDLLTTGYLKLPGISQSIQLWSTPYQHLDRAACLCFLMLLGSFFGLSLPGVYGVHKKCPGLCTLKEPDMNLAGSPVDWFVP